MNSLSRIVDWIKQCVSEGKYLIKDLTQSILAKAFRGELVPQNSDDGPFSVLLEQVQGGQAKLSKMV